MTTYYIDTNIFIDAIRDRKNIFGKNIGIPAQKMFYTSMKCKFHIAVSSWTINELYRTHKTEDLQMLFTFLRKKTVKVTHTEDDIAEAKKRSPDNFDDALHIILAEKINADAIITRNTAHFRKIGTRIPIMIPEHID